MTMAADLLARFDRQDLVYKTVNDTPLSVAILTPLSLTHSDAKTYPVIVHFHGGALVVGTNPDPAFTSRWYPPPALRSHNPQPSTTNLPLTGSSA